MRKFILIGAALTFLAPSGSVATNALYATAPGQDQYLYAINVANGTRNQVGQFGAGTYIGALAYDAASDTLYGTDAITTPNGFVTGPGNLYSIDRKTGVATSLGNIGLDSVTGLAIDPNSGLLYAMTIDDLFTGATTSSFYSIDPSTIATTFIGTNPLVPGGGFEMTVGPGGELLALGGGLFQVDVGNGSQSPIGSLTGIDARTIEYDPLSGTYFSLGNSVDSGIYSVDPLTGQRTLITKFTDRGFLGNDFYGLAAAPAIPEPTGFALFGLGSLLVASIKNRKPASGNDSTLSKTP